MQSLVHESILIVSRKLYFPLNYKNQINIFDYLTIHKILTNLVHENTRSIFSFSYVLDISLARKIRSSF
jgi:hypothetical protein